MKQAERDIDQLELILIYCARMDSALDCFGENWDAFAANTVFQDSCSCSLIQIGEAVNRLSEGFKCAHPEQPWHRIYGMRNHLVHGYDSSDMEIVWDAIKTYLPPLRAFCQEQIERAAR